MAKFIVEELEDGSFGVMDAAEPEIILADYPTRAEAEFDAHLSAGDDLTTALREALRPMKGGL